ncbi:MAG: RNA polymerase sigma factor, partial [Pirellulales bacterium]
MHTALPRAKITTLLSDGVSPTSRVRAMDSTPVSLFDRLRQPGDASAWLRFAQICTPLLHRWARHLGLQDADASDLVQEVFVALMAKMPEFHYDPSRSFRNWLCTVATNKWREMHRRRCE